MGLHFMWASTFRAPVGINFINSNVSINLFLPEGTESHKDVNLFFSRVGAKLQDGLWQVRRNLSDLSDIYGSALQLAVSSFKSLMVDYSYIQKGRYNAHFTFNSRELMEISSLIITYSDVADGYRVEYMRKLANHSNVYDWINARDKVSNVVLQISKSGNGQDTGSREVPFLLADFLDERGVKGMAISGKGEMPEVLECSESSAFSSELTSFWSRNEVLTNLVGRLASSFIVLYGTYGCANENSLKLVVPVPVQQTTALIKLMKELMAEFTRWDLKLLEVTDYEMGYEHEE